MARTKNEAKTKPRRAGLVYTRRGKETDEKEPCGTRLRKKDKEKLNKPGVHRKERRMQVGGA